MTNNSGPEAVNRKREKEPEEEPEEEPIEAEPPARVLLRAAVMIVILSGLVYWPSIHGSKIWDDTELLSGNGRGNPSSIAACFRAPFLYHYYRPLTSASFILDHRIWDHGVWGSNTFGYHLTNLLLHLITTALLLPILIIAFRSRTAALFGALLFAVQPAQVSSVAWIGGRTDSLCTLLIAVFFLALIAGARSTGTKRLGLLAASIVCYVLAALAKEQALLLLPLAPLAVNVFGSKNENAKALRSEMVSLAAIFTAAAVCVLTAWTRFGQPLHPKWNVMHQLSLVGPTIDYYALLLITPTPGLNHLMTLNSIQTLGVIGIVAGYLIGILAIGLFLRLMRSDPVVAWFLAGVLLLLAPVSNIYPLSTQTIAPYRAGTAGLCAAAVFGWAISKLLVRGKTASNFQNRFALIAIPIGIYAAWYCCLTYRDDFTWKNSLTASSAVERYDPSSVFGALETANAYLEVGSFEPAVERLDRITGSQTKLTAVVWRSSSANSLSSTGNTADWAAGLYGRAGLLKLGAGDRKTAILVLNKGKALSPQNEQVNVGLANYALAVNDFAGAEVPIRNVLLCEPHLTTLRLTLGKFLVRQQRWNEADAELTVCLSQSPGDTALWLLTAMARMKYGNRTGAAEVLADGLKQHELQADKLKDWLNSIGESSLLNVREM